MVTRGVFNAQDPFSSAAVAFVRTCHCSLSCAVMCLQTNTHLHVDMLVYITIGLAENYLHSISQNRNHISLRCHASSVLQKLCFTIARPLMSSCLHHSPCFIQTQFSIRDDHLSCAPTKLLNLGYLKSFLMLARMIFVQVRDL